MERGKMTIQLVDGNFGSVYYQMLEDCQNHIRIISPFIGRTVASSLASELEEKPELKCTIITRFYLEDFITGSSSIEGLEKLVEAGATVYALQDLHTKLYIFDENSVVMGSANFTFKGFFKNVEFGIYMENEPVFTKECLAYFNGLLEKMKAAGECLVTEDLIQKYKPTIFDNIQSRRPRRNQTFTVLPNIIKFGAVIEDLNDVKVEQVSEEKDIIEESIKQMAVPSERHTGIWLKFEGNSESRIPNNEIYLDRKRRLHEHITRTYFPTRPTGIKAGQTVFIAVLSYDEHESAAPVIVGYATTPGFREENTETSKDSFYKRTKGRYPYFIELNHGRFLKGPIKYGISLNDIIRDLRFDLYPTPKKSIHSVAITHHEKSHLQITEVAKEYIIERLEKRFEKFGMEELKWVTLTNPRE